MAQGQLRALQVAAMLGGVGLGGWCLPRTAAADQRPSSVVARAHTLDERTATLKLADVVFRHGARTPLTKKTDLWQKQGVQWDVCNVAYETVPLKLVSTKGGPGKPNAHNDKQVSHVYPGGCHMGQLTRQGQLQARDLGEWLRERYVNRYQLLPPTHQEGVIATRTTPYQRTIGTLAGVLTGLFGPPQRSTKPITTVTSTDVDEILYADTRTCPHLAIFNKMAKQRVIELVRQDPDYEWINDELERLGMASHEQRNTQDDWFFAELHDVVTSLAAAGKPIAAGFTPRMIRVLNRLATKEFAPLVAPSIKDHYGHTVLRLSMGVLLHTLTDNMLAAAGAAGEGKGAKGLPRMHLYSGHDSTVMPLLSALGQDTLESWPPYLSNLVFELWQLPASQGGHHVVRVLYNREELELPHCPPGKYLTLDAFRSEVLLPFLLSQQDLQEACKVPVGHGSSLPSVPDGKSTAGASGSAPTFNDDE